MDVVRARVAREVGGQDAAANAGALLQHHSQLQPALRSTLWPAHVYKVITSITLFTKVGEALP